MMHLGVLRKGTIGCGDTIHLISGSVSVFPGLCPQAGTGAAPGKVTVSWPLVQTTAEPAQSPQPALSPFGSLEQGGSLSPAQTLSSCIGSLPPDPRTLLVVMGEGTNSQAGLTVHCSFRDWCFQTRGLGHYGSLLSSRQCAS